MVVFFALFPLAVMIAVAIAYAVSLIGLVAYVGALLSAWLLSAYALPLLTGVMSPGELKDNIQARRRHGSHYEGELMDAGSSLWRSRTKELD
jgi:hypothetical protein